MTKFTVINFMYYFYFYYCEMSSDNTSLEQLVDLSNLIYDENDTIEIFLSLNDYDEQIWWKLILMKIIKWYIIDLNQLMIENYVCTSPNNRLHTFDF